MASADVTVLWRTAWNRLGAAPFVSSSIEGFKDKLELLGIEVPQLVTDLVGKERRLRVSEEELDYWLNSGDSVS